MITGAHVIIYSKDPESDRAFFRDVLNFTLWTPATAGSSLPCRPRKLRFILLRRTICTNSTSRATT